jgi:hypothetical protein
MARIRNAQYCFKASPNTEVSFIEKKSTVSPVIATSNIEFQSADHLRRFKSSRDFRQCSVINSDWVGNYIRGEDQLDAPFSRGKTGEISPL